MPSKYRLEAQPISILEALASGCVVLTSEVGEISRTVSEESAILLRDCSPCEIATSIIDVCCNDDLRYSLSVNALALYQRRFSYDIHIENWVELLSKL
ncbi:MAG: glycosyltransferase family 4 protein [Leptolyngbyaceae cyanobacterium SU_3_3]|nr:glycosyltransferase family 4 protein [Leptolyngbyaceae cyanobacterium SU_3_3]